jgi:hypothetical protein
MQIPRMRFTVRRMIVAVAALAVTFAYAVFVRDRYLDLIKTSTPLPLKVKGLQDAPYITFEALVHFLGMYGLPPFCLIYVGCVAVWLVGNRPVRRGRVSYVAPAPPDPE